MEIAGGNLFDIKPDKPLPAFRRTVESVPIMHEGQAMFILRDMEGISGEMMMLSPAAMLIVALMDGRNTIADVKSVVLKQTGHMVPDSEVYSLVSELKKHYFLDTDETDAKRAEILEIFKNSPVRKMTQAKLTYPDNILELSQFLGAFLKDPKGPMKLFAEKPSGASAPFGLISPHIDMLRGGQSYAWAYQALSECPVPDVIVALGVAHSGPNSPWVFTDKEYETPYGNMPVDKGLYDELKSCLWYDPKQEEYVHRTEHSLEFQALWLKYLWREKTPAWVPMLCSAFERFSPDKPPTGLAAVEGAIKAMREKLSARVQSGQKIMILAGVDMSHVGVRFGSDGNIDTDAKAKVEKEDKLSLDYALNIDADGFYSSVASDGNKRNVCGLSALYTALRLMKGAGGQVQSKGSLLSYQQAQDPLGGIVSFASAIYKN